jgi:4-methyl-5(b-hydroxyethyl)-thiazole monophosphate biosynthesis
MKSAFIHFAEGFEEIEALTIVDVLRRADIPTLMISVTGKLEVTGAHGIKVITDSLFEKTDYNNAEILILPGGMPGSKNLNEHSGLKEQLVKFNDRGSKIAAICAAPLVLGGLNILKGKKAVCYPGYENDLLGADVQSSSTLHSGNILTGRGPGAALNFSLEIVRLLKSDELATKLAKAMLVETWD